MSDQSLNGVRDAARDLLECVDTEDPHTLGDELVQMLTRKQRAALLSHAAGQVCAEVYRWSRTKTNPVGRSWKAGVSIADLLAQTYYVASEWKALAECTREEVLDIAAGYRRRAEQNLAHAEAFEALAEDMERAGAATVADLFAEGEEAA